MCKLAAVGQMIHKYDEIICSIHHGGHPASHHDPPVGGHSGRLYADQRSTLDRSDRTKPAFDPGRVSLNLT